MYVFNRFPPENLFSSQYLYHFNLMHILPISLSICNKLYPVLKKLIQEDLFFTCLQKDMNTRECYNTSKTNDNIISSFLFDSADWLTDPLPGATHDGPDIQQTLSKCVWNE